MLESAGTQWIMTQWVKYLLSSDPNILIKAECGMHICNPSVREQRCISRKLLASKARINSDLQVQLENQYQTIRTTKD